jgi:iron complex transport system substrate-binding protein
MSAFARRSRAALVALCLAAAPAAADAPPARVVSMNLCTDQLAMMLAAPGQLLSVTWLAADPRMSAMAGEAGAYRPNRGGAEEIFLMRPDLVLADEWSDAATVAMLRRLGVRVEQFPPGTSLDEVRGNILRMGALLGREREAEALLGAFGAGMAAVPAAGDPRPRAAIYGPNGWADGSASLAGQILKAAGYENVADERGVGMGAILPLEALVMAAPDLVITAPRDGVEGRADAVTRHPALLPYTDRTATTGPDWICAGPFTVRAVMALARHRTGVAE